MVEKERKVVVLTSQTVVKNEGREFYAARLQNLGLTAYGHTEEAATRALRRLFRRFIDDLRQGNKIQDRLSQLDVTWYWDNEYLDDWSSVEDTTLMHRNWSPISVQPSPQSFIMAA